MQYRTLVIRDADPANDQRMFYRLQAGYEPLENLILLARAGVVQRFVSVEDESGLRLEDASLSALLQQSVEACRAFDPNGSNTVSVDELVRGVNNTLRGCMP